ncbi:MAG: purine-nucleoside phosphorylase [Cloacibacillus sp.]
MYYWDKVNEAAAYIRKRTEIAPKAALILGSGLGRIAEQIERPEVIPYEEIPYWPRSTAPGHEGRLIFGWFRGVPVAVMQGRVHYYEGYTMPEVTFPVRVLGELGIKCLVVTNASGGINLEIPPGTVVAITDHINYMGTNPLIGVNNDHWGVRFPDMGSAYDKDYTKRVKDIAVKENIALKEGVYIAFSGPSFETPAEIKMARTLGADIVGMSTVPEVITAAHMGIKVLGLSCAANYAAGITDQKLTHQDVLQVMSASAGELSRLIERFFEEVTL